MYDKSGNIMEVVAQSGLVLFDMYDELTGIINMDANT